MMSKRMADGEILLHSPGCHSEALQGPGRFILDGLARAGLREGRLRCGARRCRCGDRSPRRAGPTTPPAEYQSPGAACRRRFHGSRRSEEHTSELQSLAYLVCRLLLEKKKNNTYDASPRWLILR